MSDGTEKAGGDDGAQKPGQGDGPQKADGVSQEILDKMFSQGFAKAKEKSESEIAALKAQVEDLGSKIEKAALEKAEADGDLKKVAEQQKKIAEEAQAKALEIEAKYRSAVAKNAAIISAEKHDAVDGEVVFRLISDRIIVKDDGSVEFSGASSLDEGVKAFLAERQYLVKPSGTKGSGLPGSTTPPQQGASALLDELNAAKNPKELAAVIEKHRKKAGA